LQRQPLDLRHRLERRHGHPEERNTTQSAPAATSVAVNQPSRAGFNTRPAAEEPPLQQRDEQQRDEHEHRHDRGVAEPEYLKAVS